MNEKILEALVVPYDVERRDTAMARGPVGRFGARLPGAAPERGLGGSPGRSNDPGGSGSPPQCRGRALDRPGRGRRSGPRALSPGALRRLPRHVGVVTGLRDPGRTWRRLDRRPRRLQHRGHLAAATGTDGSRRGLRTEPEGRPGGARPSTSRCAPGRPPAGRSFDPLEVENFRRRGLAAIPPDRIATADTLEIRQLAAALPARGPGRPRPRGRPGCGLPRAGRPEARRRPALPRRPPRPGRHDPLRPELRPGRRRGGRADGRHLRAPGGCDRNP